MQYTYIAAGDSFVLTGPYGIAANPSALGYTEID